MKTFSSELAQHYASYTFGYANYCRREPGDRLAKLYALGYLPYSGSPEAKDIFYLARSARVPLVHWSRSSENRRIAKKFDGRFTLDFISPAELAADPAAVDFCLAYFAERHGPAVMPPARLQFILHSGLVSQAAVYSEHDQPVAYVLEVCDGPLCHFWYSFYDLKLVRQSLGMWLMLDSARRAQARGQQYFYIGTVYGEKALYKTAFTPLEFWDGRDWVRDNRKIKQWGRSDDERTVGWADRWKMEQKRF